MKLLAQDGFGPGDKIKMGLEKGVIDGALLSSRYRGPDTFGDKLNEVPSGAFLFDPHYHAYQYFGNTNAQLGKLGEWDYFTAPRRSALINGSEIKPVIQKVIETQRAYPLMGYITPNVYVNSADSIDAAIALNFIGSAKKVAQAIGINDKPVFATLALDRDVLVSGGAPLNDFIGALTSLETFPDGFYLLVGSGTVDEDGRHIRSDIFDEKVIAGWMYINHVLSINGFKVVNGFSDLLSPLLGICGAYAGATGWSTNLRQFSMGRYVRPSKQGGSAPLIRYVSCGLLARIKQTEHQDFSKIDGRVSNGLASDKYYGGETTRTEEALQSWDAIKDLCDKTISGDLERDLASFLGRIEKARALWSGLEEAGFSSGVEAQYERLDAIRDGIARFKKLAELV